MRLGFRHPLVFGGLILILVLSVSYLVIDSGLNQTEEQENSLDSFIVRRNLYAQSRERKSKSKNLSLEDSSQQSQYPEKQMHIQSNPTEVEPDLWSVDFPPTIQNTRSSETVSMASVAKDLSNANQQPSLSKSNCSSELLRDDVFVRNCLTGDVIGRIPNGMKTSPIRVPQGLTAESRNVRRRSFEQVFEKRAWGHGWDPQNTGLNASGMGATLVWTQELIGTLHVLIERIKRERAVSRVRLLDVPCGDLAWMSRFLKTRDDVDYTGVDIVPAIIEHHQRTYKGQSSWKFQRKDILEEPLKETFDIILCRTLMQHLYTYDVIRLLKQFSDGGSTYLLTTSFYQEPKNVELKINIDNPGRFRKLNLQVPPISLVPPRCLTRDGPPDVFEGWDHFIGLWKLPLRQVRQCKDPAKFKLTEINIFSCTDWSYHDNGDTKNDFF